MMPGSRGCSVVAAQCLHSPICAHVQAVYQQVDRNFPVGVSVCARGFKFGRCKETGATIVHDRNAAMSLSYATDEPLAYKPSWCYATEVQALVAQVLPHAIVTCP